MKALLKQVAKFEVLGLFAAIVSGWTGSQFLPKFIEANLITILIALAAINTTTLTVLLGKLRELSNNDPGRFSQSVEEMRKSIVEQVAVINLAFWMQIVRGSEFFISAEFVRLLFDGTLAGILLWSIYNLHDTAIGIFVLWEFEDGKVAHPEKQ